MASAAAVAADVERSPIRNTIGEDRGHPGEITSGIYARDESPPDGIDSKPAVEGENQDGEDDDEEEDAPSNRRRRERRNQNEEDEEGEATGPGVDDLFGDDEDEEPADASEKPRDRVLDDEELDSGDDMDRTDRVLDQAQEEPETAAPPKKRAMDLELSRGAVPEPSDGEMYLMKMPTFMSIEPKAWDHKKYQPPTTDHHSKKTPSATFSAYNTALTTVRWRHSPSDPSQLQSNARIHRWSDGSLTLQLASDPTTQYEIDGNALAPPQRNPSKPTPVSTRTSNRPNERYNVSKEAFTYLVRPLEEQESLRVTHKITAGLSIKQSSTAEDDALEKLNASMAAAANATRVQGASGTDLVSINEDPEQAKLQALAAVREADKMRKRQQAAQEREAARNTRVMGRSGVGANRYSGLNVGMLEDDEEGGGLAGARGGRKRPGAGVKGRRRRNSEYSEDEDFGRKRFAQREDEYDEEDDFVAPSDEEEVGVEGDDDEDEDDGIVEEGRRGSPKRGRSDEEEDAPGEVEDEDDDAVQQARTKRRRVVDEEDEDE